MRLSFIFIVVLGAAGIQAALALEPAAGAAVQSVATEKAVAEAAEATTEVADAMAQTAEAATEVASTTEIYRWVDAQGRVHYGDHPLANAQPVVVNPVMTEFARPPVAAESQPLSSDNNDAANRRSASANSERTATIIPAPSVTVSFVEPDDEQSIRANDGNLRVRWQAQAERLNSGLLFLLRHNDRVVYQGEAPVYNFENLDRGAHTLQVQAVVNDKGRAGDLLAESAPITVYILRASILNPNNPLNRTNLVQK